MGQATRRASPRITCPTDDDADGLRYLYPECDQLTQCEMGGANSTGCQTYVLGYNYDEAYQIVYEEEDGGTTSLGAACKAHNTEPTRRCTATPAGAWMVVG